MGILVTTSSQGRISGNPRPGNANRFLLTPSIYRIDKICELHEGGGISFWLLCNCKIKYLNGKRAKYDPLISYQLDKLNKSLA